MIDDELMNKFDCIEDLPISAELLGAYLEGNLTDAEVSDVELMIQHQPGLCELYADVTQSLVFPYFSQDNLDSVDYINCAIIEDQSHFIDNNDSGLSNMLSNVDLPSLDDTTLYGNSFNDYNFGLDVDLNSDNDFNLNL